jgi:hypothetical protein
LGGWKAPRVFKALARSILAFQGVDDISPAGPYPSPIACAAFANFATDRHNGGASARKIQNWLGQSDLETTLRYLEVGEDTSDEVCSIVNGVHVGL